MSTGECITKYNEICKVAYTEKKRFFPKSELFSATRFEEQIKRLVEERGGLVDEDELMRDTRENAPKV
jgi:hypothetical protein